MSKNFKSFLFVFAALVQILHLFNNSNAQNIYASITIDPATSSLAKVEGKFRWEENGRRRRNFSFLLDYAGITNLGDRVSEVSLKSADGSTVKCRRLMPGEYLAESDFDEWAYTIDLSPLKSPKAIAHISWLSAGHGILFLNDILPQADGSSSVEIKKGTVLTDFGDNSLDSFFNWYLMSQLKVYSVFQNKNYRQVFYYAPEYRYKEIQSKRTRLSIGIEGKWKFSDEMASKMSVDIFQYYEHLFGQRPSWFFDINIKPFPVNVDAGNYEADTRGNYVTIVSSDAAFESESVQRLHEQLRHELFHLWFPNGVNLTGNYDWFYEGFALYQSLKIGVALNRIRFDDYLDTLSRAYDLDRRLETKLSLIDVSNNRWSGDNNTKVYARGMLVAFLCDLALLERSTGKRSTTDLLRELYEKNRPPNTERDGNTTVLALLREHSELTPIIKRNITGAETIDWSDLIRAAGLAVDSTDQTTKLKVTAKLSGSQKNLLDKLGYNNWRKLASKR
jgi:hypothetical protein